MKEIITSITLFFSSLTTTDITTNLYSERAHMESLQSEVKTYKRQNQLLEINDLIDPAGKYLQIEKNKKKIISLDEKIKEIKKIVDLKQTWVVEDSLESVRKSQSNKLK